MLEPKGCASPSFCKSTCLSVYAGVISSLGSSIQLGSITRSNANRTIRIWRGSHDWMTVARSGPCDEMRLMGENVDSRASREQRDGDSQGAFIKNVRNSNTLNLSSALQSSNTWASLSLFLDHPRLLSSYGDCWHNYSILGKSYIPVPQAHR